MTPTLVTGGVRSGKSRHAEHLLSPDEPVRYLAPGPEPDQDPEWAARVAAHRRRRPAAWSTVETHDVPPVLATPGPVLFDCLGTWLTATLDELDAWERPEPAWAPELADRIAAVAAACAGHEGDLVVVTNEVGWSLVSEHRSGRVFTDWLGRANQAVAAVCAEVHLVVAGRVLVL